MERSYVMSARLGGTLGPEWAAVLEGLAVVRDGRDTRLRGVLVDQASLHGVLDVIRDLGLDLVSLEVRSRTNPAAPKED
jgi:hypothetical protein